MKETIFQIVRVVAVIASLGVASALATPKGRLPIAIRGLRKIMRRDANIANDSPDYAAVSPIRRFFAFLFILIAILLAIV